MVTLADTGITQEVRKKIANINIRVALKDQPIDIDTGKVTLTVNSEKEWKNLVSSLVEAGYSGSTIDSPPGAVLDKDDKSVYNAGDFRPAGSTTAHDLLIHKAKPLYEDKYDLADGSGTRVHPGTVKDFPAQLELDAKIVMAHHPDLAGPEKAAGNDRLAKYSQGARGGNNFGRN